MFLSGCSQNTKSRLLVLAVLLFVLQFNALFIHELGLLYQGYELVYDPPDYGREVPPEKTTLRETGVHNYYNIATCRTHFLLQILSSFTGVSLAAFLLADRLSGLICGHSTKGVIQPDFCWVRIPRAPPSLPSPRS